MQGEWVVVWPQRPAFEPPRPLRLPAVGLPQQPELGPQERPQELWGPLAQVQASVVAQ